MTATTATTPPATDRTPPKAVRRAGPVIGWVAVAGWAVLVAAARRRGLQLSDELGPEAIRLNAPPLVGFRDLQLGWALLLPVAVGLAGVWCCAVVLPRLRWRHLLLAVVALTVCWSVALAMGRSPVKGADPDQVSTAGLTRPMVLPGDEYLLDVPLVGDDPIAFLGDFTDRIDDHVTHVRSHPPGFLLVLWTLDRAGLGTPGWAAALVIAAGASVGAAVLVALRVVAGEGVARGAAPFLALGPAALWLASTGDAFFAAVAAWAVVLVVLATASTGRRSTALAGAGGLLWGAALLLSYGLALLAVPLAVVLVGRRRLDLVLPVAVGAAVLPGAFWLAGFSWLDGLHTTRREYDESVAATRPQRYFVWANLAALGVAVGPATVAGLARLRDARVWLLVGGMLAAMVLADLTGLSKGEVERIWLPYSLWLPAACVALVPDDPRDRRWTGWLGAQGTVAVAVQALVRTRW